MFQVAEQALRALEELEAAGYEAYMVGGFVRDLLAGVMPNDYDIATNALPEAVREVFSFCRVIDTGIRHGTVTVLLDGLTIEVTTYRREGPYTDGRHPDSVVYVNRLEEDLARRDFTINAMAWHPYRGLVDLYHGRRDYEEGIVRCVGDPEDRFQEDALRILRAIRFASQLRFWLEPKTQAALFRHKDGIRFLAQERITAELNRILCGCAAGAVLLQYAEIFAIAIPELCWRWCPCHQGYRLGSDRLTHAAVALDRVRSDRVIRWAVLLHSLSHSVSQMMDPEGGMVRSYTKAELADVILRRLRFDKATRVRIVTLLNACEMTIPRDRKSVRRSIYQLTPDVFFEMLEVKHAETLGQIADYQGKQEECDQLEALARQILEEEGYLTLRDLAVTGNDLLSQGYHGSEIGMRLARILDAVLDGKVPNEKEALLKFEEEENV